MSRITILLASTLATAGRTYRAGERVSIDRAEAEKMLADGRATLPGFAARHPRKPGEMLLRLSIHYTHVRHGEFEPGDVLSLPRHDAQALLSQGHAVEIPLTLADLLD